MTAISIVAAAAMALVDWVGVWRGKKIVEQVAKPLVPAWLIGVVVVSGEQGTAAALVATALVFALAGDVALLPVFDRVMWALGSFLIAHLLFIAAFLRADPELGIAGSVATAGVLIVMGFAGHRIVSAVSRGPDPSAGLARAVAVYALVLAAMVVAAISTGDRLAVAGAALFAVSDGVLGWNRFVVSLAHGRLKTHVLYHLALILLTAWVAL